MKNSIFTSKILKRRGKIFKERKISRSNHFNSFSIISINFHIFRPKNLQTFYSEEKERLSRES